MDGVTILNIFTEELEVIQPWYTIGLLLTFGGFAGFLFFSIIGSISESIFCAIMHFICVVCVIVGIFIGLTAPRETETRYQVIIDDSVSFNEFQEHYEIIEVNGKIYTVKPLDK